jgi:uncharacterized protein (TIGR03083 family)
MVGVLSGNDVVRAATLVTNALTAAADRSWDVPVPDLEFTVGGVVAHAAEVCLWYAIDFTAAGADLVTVEHHVHPDRGSNELLLQTVTTYARVLAATLEAAPRGQRGFHPMGRADASGFAAMGCDELLIHGDDAARGLGIAFRPDLALCDRVVRRLFPWVDVNTDPWKALRYANGRIALDDRHPKLEGWSWHCAPLDEWGGSTSV